MNDNNVNQNTTDNTVNNDSKSTKRLIGLTTTLAAIACVTSTASLISSLYLNYQYKEANYLSEDTTTDEAVLQKKADELSKILNSPFETTIHSSIITTFTNQAGSITLEFDVDQDGDITHAFLDSINNQDDKEINEMATKFAEYIISTSKDPEGISNRFSEYVNEIKTEEFINSQEYKDALKDRMFYTCHWYNNDSYYADFTTMDNLNPDRAFQISVSY